MDASTKSDELLTTRQAASVLQVAEKTVRAWANTGAISGVKYGASWRFRREALFAPTAKTEKITPQTNSPLQAEINTLIERNVSGFALGRIFPTRRPRAKKS